MFLGMLLVVRHTLGIEYVQPHSVLYEYELGGIIIVSIFYWEDNWALHAYRKGSCSFWKLLFQFYVHVFVSAGLPCKMYFFFL